MGFHQCYPSVHLWEWQVMLQVISAASNSAASNSAASNSAASNSAASQLEDEAVSKRQACVVPFGTWRFSLGV